MIMADAEGKKLTELRVIDLKTELERRGLDKTGNKAALLERLSKAISEEGEDPEEYLIVPCVGTNKISPRKNSVTGTNPPEEPQETQESNHKEESVDNSKDIEEIKRSEEPKSLVAEVEAKPSPKNETPETVEDEPSVEEEEKEEVKEEQKEELKEEQKEEEEEKEVEEVEVQEEPMEVQSEDKKESVKESEKVESVKEPEKKTSPEATPIAPPPPAIVPDTTSATIEANGIDNEDSINLTIGEDEENLLAEETETHVKQKVGLIVPADGGGKKRIEDNSKKGDSKGSRGDTGGKDSGSNSTGNKSKDDGGKSESSNKGQKRDDKDKKTASSSANAGSRNLWVSGLSSTTRATDLKQIFSKYGKVIGAKVVTNARTPGARCYGYVTMSTSEDAAKCIQHLHRTELHGRVISVEKAKGDSQQGHMRKRESTNGKPEKKDEKEKPKDSHHDSTSDKKEKTEKKETEDKSGDKSPKKTDDKSHSDDKKPEATEKKEEGKDGDARSTKSTSKKPEGERKRDDKRARPADGHRASRSRSRERRRKDDVLTFAKIREERERQRLRDRERLLREEERRRREDMERQREIERRQREEAARLEREREKLRREREKIEQEKAELLRLERERQKQEREKLERERLELKRQQMRLEESRRVPPPPAIKRSSSDRRDIREMYAEPERKRLTTEHSRRHSPERVSDRRTEILDRVSDRRIDGSPSGRYDSTRSTQDLTLKKRGSEFSSRSSRPETFTDVSRGREVIVRRETLPTATSTIDPRQVKESRYERPSSTSYGRSEREVRRNDADNHRSSRDSSRYSDSSKPPGSSSQGRDSRYSESSRTPSGWHGGAPSSKSFNAVSSSGSQRSDVRNEPSSWSNRSSEGVNRWVSSSSGNTLRHPGPPIGYQGGPIQSMGITAPGTTPSNERFDPYKYSMPSLRKY
ncbi:SAFB-like transcription modulator isoform X2 [Diachasma alloeum]|uniref:SAFB-like transcription modulator isoform X2 n=1 Tax=Diachasma alloeum TaxID=454923 RepID=UPI0007383E81|nr:SAFB-like transcription modulator isoform X2 [Diachasma alloeum]